ncbi:hypothetical protein NX722_18445 [Endozoicomonas gorgoniicola]|uniref:Uncharacterized protein n=1 Tax=Endozoicomonas gorgoniicola TaxID=1234144 RepID=A0ABT3MYV6_9GAMM|nr:hypothetical protein [Endozoicomonas gorgoniicola]MCW7554562.1 hypothetical protein [Endozoicomonas gorgoniicola]
MSVQFLFKLCYSASDAGGIMMLIKRFIQDIRDMHWAPRLILLLVVLKTLAVMIREAAV